VDVGFFFNLFVDWDGSMNDMWLDGFPFNDRLDDVVNVMVDMFANDYVCGGTGFNGENFTFILEL